MSLFTNKIITHFCKNCKDPFKSKAPNALYCKKPECQKAKQLSWHRSKMTRQMKERKIWNKLKRGPRFTYKKKHRNFNPCQFIIDHDVLGTNICGCNAYPNRYFCEKHWPQISDYLMIEQKGGSK